MQRLGISQVHCRVFVFGRAYVCSGVQSSAWLIISSLEKGVLPAQINVSLLHELETNIGM